MHRKTEPVTLEGRRLDVQDVQHVHLKHETVRINRTLEHELAVRDVFANHPALVWWSFYWSMAAVGWYALARVGVA